MARLKGIALGTLKRSGRRRGSILSGSVPGMTIQYYNPLPDKDKWYLLGTFELEYRLRGLESLKIALKALGL